MVIYDSDNPVEEQVFDALETSLRRNRAGSSVAGLIRGRMIRFASGGRLSLPASKKVSGC